MSQCSFCRAEVPDGASVCRGCGAEKVKGYVSRQTLQFLAIVGAIIGIPTAVVVKFLTGSTPLMVIVMVVIMYGPILFEKLRNKNKESWIRRTAR